MDPGARRSPHSSRKVPLIGAEGEEEFQEEDVWSVLREGETTSPEMIISKSHFSSTSSPWHIQRSKEVSGVKQLSAPMSVPDWSKVYGNDTIRSSRNLHTHGDADDDDDGGSMVPPHVLVAKKLARKEISSFSMCEGIGRTLKGRDLKKVRNAVLRKTGFLE